MAFLRSIIAALLLVFVIGCNKDDGSGCFTSVGDIVIEERAVESAFTYLEVYDNAVVTIKQGSEFKISVRGGSNLIPAYKTRIEGQKLIIKNDTKCNWTRDLNTPFEVFVTMPRIDSIFYYGYGDIYSDGVLDVDTFLIETKDGLGLMDLQLVGKKLDLIMHTGATNLNLKGSFDYVYTYSTSYSIIDMSELVATRGFYVNGGTGNFWVNTSEYIKIQLMLSGNIYYNQDPEIYIETHTGSGQLIHY